MKIMIASDLHGDADAVRQLLQRYAESGAERLLLLGDLLYHGPRNDLPPGYAPREVISLLSSLSPAPLCVRGNCDAEVDQMVLPFPILADYAQFCWDDLHIFATHGHHFSPQSLPPLAPGEIFLYGHTHRMQAEWNAAGVLCLNPGSPSLPKEGDPPSYMLYAARTFSFFHLDGHLLSEVRA